MSRRFQAAIDYDRLSMSSARSSSLLDNVSELADGVARIGIGVVQRPHQLHIRETSVDTSANYKTVLRAIHQAVDQYVNKRLSMNLGAMD